MAEKRSPLQRRVAPSVTASLEYPDGKIDFRLAFNNNALARIEESTGLNLLANPYALWGKVSKSRLGVIFWAGLLQDRPELASDEGLLVVRSYLDSQENELRAFNAVWEAYLLYLPKEQAEELSALRAKAENESTEKKDGAEPQPAEKKTEQPESPQTGSSSGPSADSISGSALANSAS